MNAFFRSLIVLALTVFTLSAQTPDADIPKLRAKATKQREQGNWKDALESYQSLLSLPGNVGSGLGDDLKQADVCQQNLNQRQNLDSLVEKALAAHPQDWHLLASAAQVYAGASPDGSMVDNQFQRGVYDGGKFVSSFARDRVRSMQWMEQALLQILKPETSVSNEEREAFFHNFSQMLQTRESWELQALTDLSKLPDYEESPRNSYGRNGRFYGSGNDRGAPVDAKGNPVYHQKPASWQVAKSDGERWRWLLAEWGKVNALSAPAAEMKLAQFLKDEFDVRTIAQWWRPSTDEDGTQKNNALMAIHTLKEDETTARLANGIKRFTLAEEFDFVGILKRLAEQKLHGGVAYEAALSLAATFQDRRQYDRAAEYYRKALAMDLPKSTKQDIQRTLDQILKNWGRFDSSLVQAAGKGAKVGFVFRNGNKVHFSAKKVDVQALLADVKKYLSANPDNIDYQKVQVQQLGYTILEKNKAKYIGKEVAAWDVDLEPRAGHWDRRIDVTTPLQNSGAYVLEAAMENGNTSAIMVWLADTAIVKRPGDKEQQYFVVDAATGAPVSKANVEFFGYRMEPITEKRLFQRRSNNIITRNFAESTDELGQLFSGEDRVSQSSQWLITATTPEGRFAYLGFTGVWYPQQTPDQYQQQKAHIITDRPVYRPGQSVKFKAWLRRANYDAPMDRSEFANQSFHVEINNAKNEKCFDKMLTTDAFGGLADELTLPEDANLGVYHFSIWDSKISLQQNGTFRVEEYKKPEYEVKVDAPAEPLMLGDKVTAKVTANYYFGAPVVNAKVKYKVMRSSHDARWFPAREWDWFYGAGYWWFAYDYEWYPGWKRWGCVAPVGWWWGRQPDPPELVLENEASIGPDGTVSIEIDTALAKELHPDEDHRYEITVEVTDESRRTIVGTGQVLVARQPFKVNVWTDRGHYEVGQPIEIGVKALTLDRKGVAGNGTWSLQKLSYNEKAEPKETEIKSEALKTDAEGAAKLKLSASEAGQYRLLATVTDAKGHKIEGAYIFVVRGQAANGKDFRFDDLELVADKAEYGPGDEVKLLVNTAQRDSTVYLFARSSQGIAGHPRVMKLSGKSTSVPIKVATGDMPNFFIEAFTVSDGKVHTAVREIAVPPAKRVLNLEVLADSAKHKPQDKAKVKLKLTDLDGKPFQGQTVVTVYDKALEYISGGSNVADIKEFFWKWRRHYSSRNEHSLQNYAANLSVPQDAISMGTLGSFGGDVEITTMYARGGFGGGRARSKSALGVDSLSKLAEAPMPASMAAPAAEAKLEGADKLLDFKSDAGATAEEPAVTVRSAFADAVYWTAALDTNADGIAEIEVPLPDNLTTWKIKSWAMGHGTRVGEGEAEIITSKDLIIRQQAPRFFVEKDEVVLSANVHNYHPDKKEVKVSLEFDGACLEALPGQSMSQAISLESQKEQRVDWRVKVAREGTAVVRMKAITDGDSDAMQMSYPVFVHGILKTDSFSGAMKPDVTSGKIEINVPNERRVEQSRLEIRYSPTIATAMLDAIPYLAQYPHGCTEQTLNRFLPAVLAHKTLLDSGIDLKAIQEKLTNLNPQEIGDPKARAAQWDKLLPPDKHPVFNENEYGRIVRQGLERLTAMQNADGGWGWFSGEREESYPHTTAVVVHGLVVGTQAGLTLVPNVLENGISWLKRHEAGEVARIKRWPNGKDAKQQADELDAFIHMVISEHNAGEANVAMRDFLYRDRNDLEVYAKACLGLALDFQKQTEKRDMLLQNIEQYLVLDGENQTARLDLRNGGFWWSWYGSEFEADAFYLKLLTRVDPKSDKASGLVKFLVNNRKNATYWTSTRDTAYVLEALNDYLKATKETSPDLTVQVLLDGELKKEVKITKENLFTFDGSLILTGKVVPAGKHTVEFKKTGTGPLYFNAYVTNFTLEDRITKAGLEVKVERKYYKLTQRKDATALVSGSSGQAIQQKTLKYDRELIADGQVMKSGDLVEVELTIDSKNDYEYLLFQDLKPAGFEAEEVRSGYVYEGLSAYREFHDERVCFYLRTMPLGKHSLSYRLKAEIPGKFSALPAQASAMYAPELRGNSDEMKLGVED